jgi:hypothetical protein
MSSFLRDMLAAALLFLFGSAAIYFRPYFIRKGERDE